MLLLRPSKNAVSPLIQPARSLVVGVIVARGGVGLLLDVVLGAALLRLAEVVLPLELLLLRAVAGEAGHGAADGALEAVAGAADEVVGLALGLLLLAIQVLLAAGLLQRLFCGSLCQKTSGLLVWRLKAV